MLQSFFQRYIRTSPWFLVLLISWICYASVLAAPSVFWPAIFLSLLIPLMLFVNLLLLIYLAFRRSPHVVVPALGLLTGLPFLLTTVQYHKPKQNHKEFSVLSFNAKLFRKADTYSEFSTEMIQWVASDRSSIKCIQEFSTDSIWTPVDATKQIKSNGYNAFVWKASMRKNDHNRGLAIFSTFAILKSGIVWQDSTTFNGAIFSDLNCNGDTIRVYNVHLASMNLEPAFILSPDFPAGIFRIFNQLKTGTLTREAQIKLLLAHAHSCHYPVLICGDFNDIPYTYNYRTMKSSFRNAFDEAGRGFGFTLNGNIPGLRIDHQFFNEQLVPLGFRVDRSMTISDHFPTRGVYSAKIQ